MLLPDEPDLADRMLLFFLNRVSALVKDRCCMIGCGDAAVIVSVLLLFAPPPGERDGASPFAIGDDGDDCAECFARDAIAATIDEVTLDRDDRAPSVSPLSPLNPPPPPPPLPSPPPPSPPP